MAEEKGKPVEKGQKPGSEGQVVKGELSEADAGKVSGGLPAVQDKV